MPSIRFIASALALLTAPLAAQADIVNGNFETDPVANKTFVITMSPDGWQTGTLGIELRRNLDGQAFAGNTFVELDTTANSAMWQQVQTEVGLDYTLTGYYSPRPGVVADSNPIRVFWNDALLGTLGGSGVNVTTHQWSLFSYAVKGTGLDTVRFAAAGTSDSYGGSLDQISLQAAPMAVPEPASLALVLLALGAAGATARRRGTARP